MTETRNSTSRMSETATPTKGVGGRLKQSALSQTVGRYQNICPELELSFLDLKKILRAPALLAIANAIGVDQFIALWQAVDDSEYDGAYMRMPEFSTFEKYCRNAVIITLSKQGVSVPDIRLRLQKAGLEICRRQIYNVLSSASEEIGE